MRATTQNQALNLKTSMIVTVIFMNFASCNSPDNLSGNLSGGASVVGHPAHDQVDNDHHAKDVAGSVPNLAKATVPTRPTTNTVTETDAVQESAVQESVVQDNGARDSMTQSHVMTGKQNAMPSVTRVGPANAVNEEIFDELSAVAKEEGCELLHVGRTGPALQLVIDHPGGITHTLCATISRQSGALLDGLDYSNGRYVLEVTSPGVDRELYSVEDIAKSVGLKVRITHRTGGRKATVRGELESFSVSTLTVSVFNEDAKRSEEIALQDVQTARLQVQV